MTRFVLAALVLLSLLVPLCADAPLGPRDVPPKFAPLARVETHRIRVLNVEGGPIQVSTDGGGTWRLVGRVTAPATQSLPGYLASGYAPPGTVAATAVHGIRIRVGGLNTAYPKMINLVPREFAITLKTFGGHTSGTSGIYTNIPSGTGIFRDLSPYVGNRVYLESDTTAPLPVGYVPHIGDTLTIVVRRPLNPLAQVVFQNHAGGNVTATYADGTGGVFTHVVKPLLGTGRFDGTSYTGVGAINTNHCGVITVSTAPVTTSHLLEGDGPERRGGFQIEPAYHNSQSEEAGAPMVLVVGVPGRKFQMDQEGRPPLFSGEFNLAWDGRDSRHSWVAQIQRGDGTPWLPMIQSLGFHPDAFRGVTALRLICADPGDDAWLDARASDAAQDYLAAARQEAEDGKTPIQRGRITIQAADRSRRAQFVAFYVDGVLKGITNQAPFAWTWDTSDSPDGEYLVEARAEDANGRALSSSGTKLWVDNAHALHPLPTRTAKVPR